MSPSRPRRTRVARHDLLLAFQRELTGMIRWATNTNLHATLVAKSGVPIDRGQVSLLGLVADEQPARPSSLADSYGLDLSTVSKALRDLEGRGYVVRETDPEDGRAVLISLSAKGERALAKLRDELVEWHEQLVAEWTDEEIAEFSNYVRRYRENVRLLLSSPEFFE